VPHLRRDLGSALPHLPRDSADPCMLPTCTWTRLSLLPHLHLGWAHPGHICTRTLGGGEPSPLCMTTTEYLSLRHCTAGERRGCVERRFAGSGVCGLVDMVTRR
jgi:hypothetical protein